MQLYDFILLGFQNLLHSKLRTMLTILGVVIGIGALVSMVSFGTGMQKNITDEFKKNELFTTLHCMQGSIMDEISGILDTAAVDKQELIINDSLINEINKLEKVIIAYPLKTFPVKMKYGGNEIQTNLQVLPAELHRFPPYDKLLAGKFYQTDSTPGMVINQSSLNKLKIRLCNEKPCALSANDSARNVQLVTVDSVLNSTLKIISVSVDIPTTTSAMFRALLHGPEELYSEKEYELEIKGIIKHAGEFGFGLIEGGGAIPPLIAKQIPHMEFSKVTELFDKQKMGSYSMFFARTASTDDIDEVKQELENMGLNVVSLYDQLERIKKQFLLLDSMLGIVGIIALMVAALGIINTMIMSILERRKEIGIMKSLGASEFEIKVVFLTEAAVIGFIGAVFGIILGWVITRIAGFAFNEYFLKDHIENIELFYFPVWLILGSIAFAMLVGILAGLYPAAKAARVDPVRALRHD